MSAESDCPVKATTNAQRAAADPRNSAFVSANAGAGKTKVLTDRVARLLLAGTPPSRILCITFTKAAAAEMANRLFAVLGEWALLGDEALNAALDKLEGDSPAPRSPDVLAQARRLFARALETPGGLKIQTIHSFCEHVLKRFPLEAGLAPGFSVIEESEARALAAEAVDQIAAERKDAALARAFAHLAGHLGAGKLKPLLLDGAVSRLGLSRALESAGGWKALEEEVARGLGVDATEKAEAARARFLATINHAEIARARKAIEQSGTNAQKYVGAPLARLLESEDANARWAALSSLFLTGGKPRKNLGDKKTDAHDDWVRPYLKSLQTAFVDANERALAAAAFCDTRAYLRVIRGVWRCYEAMKSARAAHDYDDLIARAQSLFAARQSAAWVLYKLDQGLDHILLDEAQDTSPAQWRVIEGPLAEFFSGEGAREIRRTFFAVGDQKQSIYSFQGADASLFKEKRKTLGKNIAAAAPFVEEPLTLSFRTTAPVLRFVDALFGREEARDGLWEETLRHGVFRRGAAGLVELWPLTPRETGEASEPWDAPLDSLSADNPKTVLANEVAALVAHWLKEGEILESAGRPVRAGDIMILVQSRGALFHEMIRALGRCGAPVAGADRLLLLEDAAVGDLLAYARAALLEEDDLSLAELLKSPFFGFDDDDLLKLAPSRKGALWRALVSRADEDERWGKAVEEIRRARRVARKEGAYAFLAHILETGDPSGRARLYQRLGAASRETIDELLRQALDYERAAPRSLQGFLLWASVQAGEIKREMDQTSGAVRVMTVHGAKGLEAPIVFLLDAHRPPATKKIGPLLDLAPDDSAKPVPPGVPALSAGASEECAALQAARERKKILQYQEYRRLLYVAATRARDRLYICGVELGNRKRADDKPVVEKTWHALAIDAFDRLDDVETAPPLSWPGPRLRIRTAQTAAIETTEARGAVKQHSPPPWLRRPAAPETPPRRLAPSALADEAEAKSEPAAFSPTRPRERFLRGRSLHRLLELLPEIAPGERAGAADRLLARLAPTVEAGERAAWREEALSVLADPAFSPVFAPGSRAEAAIAGAPKGAADEIFISGQIDRLAVTEKEVLIVDYKTNRPPPRRLEDIPPAYIAQLAAYRALIQEIYPDHQIEAALLWTYEARLTPIPQAMLDHAFARHIA